MGQLYIVPTPIGNLEDISFRAVNILKEAHQVLAEDTRVSGKLLKHYAIATPMRSYHQHNEHRIVDQIIARLQGGEVIALISDAGTPGISDPGYLIVRECVARKINVICLPGATALIPAIVQSGIPSDRFVFEGFLPVKKGRKKKLTALAEEERTLVIYESPYRVLKTLQDLKEHLGQDRSISVSREISKKFESTVNGKLAEVLEYFEHKKPKGEFVFVVAGK
jgi:16S rRNA (cytidine1402-2'-O)-methyltransferase